MNPDIFQSYPVRGALQPYIRRLMVAFQTHAVDLQFAVPATGYCYLGWIPRGRWRGIVNGTVVFDSDRDGPLFVSGQILDADVRVEMSGKVVQVFAEFTATGQYELYHLPGRKNVETATPLAVSQTGLTLKGLTTSSALVDHFQSVVARRVPSARPAPAHVAAAVARMEAVDGNLKIADLIADLDVSDRQLRRDFTDIVGLPPKRFCRALQINGSLMSLLAMGNERLADIAGRYGYADQAHMTRSFVEFLGKSPQLLSQDIEPTLAKFVGQSRARSP